MDLPTAMKNAQKASDADLIERGQSHAGRADFYTLLCDCHELATRLTQARAEARREALSEASKFARSTFCRNCRNWFDPEAGCTCDRPNWDRQRSAEEISEHFRALAGAPGGKGGVGDGDK